MSIQKVTLLSETNVDTAFFTIQKKSVARFVRVDR